MTQEVLAHWWLARRTYRPGGGANPRTFMKAVTRRRLADLLKEATSSKRTVERRAISLRQPLDDDDPEGASLESLLDANAEDPEVAAEHAELRDAIARHRDRLTPGQNALLDELLAERSISEIGRRTGAPRTTLNDQLKALYGVLRSDELRALL